MICSRPRDNYLPVFDQTSQADVDTVPHCKHLFRPPDPVSYYNPLHIAVLRNRPSMVRLLVSRGADVEKRDRVREASPLLFLSSSSRLSPADVCGFFSCQIHESSPLDLASEESERLPCLLTLLDMGAYVNAGDKHSTFFFFFCSDYSENPHPFLSCSF